MTLQYLSEGFEGLLQPVLFRVGVSPQDRSSLRHGKLDSLLCSVLRDGHFLPSAADELEKSFLKHRE